MNHKALSLLPDPIELSYFAVEVHGLAVAKGWWEPREGVDEYSLIAEKTVMVTSEVAEVIELYRRRTPILHVWYDLGGVKETITATQERCTALRDFIENGVVTSKPEGIPIELADVLIRLLDLIMFEREESVNDLATAAKKALTECSSAFLTSHLPAMLNAVQGALYEGGTAEAAMLTLCLGAELGIPMLDAARAKHTYNATRERRHGGKLC